MDEERTDSLIREHNGVYIDFSRQNMTDVTLQLLLNLAERAKLRTKMNAMFAGDHINVTEDRAVLHTALRARREDSVFVDGKDVVPDIWEVLDKIKDFTGRLFVCFYSEALTLKFCLFDMTACLYTNSFCPTNVQTRYAMENGLV